MVATAFRQGRRCAALMIVLSLLSACGGRDLGIEDAIADQLGQGEMTLQIDSEVAGHDFAIVCPYTDPASLDQDVRDALDKEGANLLNEGNQYFVLTEDGEVVGTEPVSQSVVNFCTEGSTRGKTFSPGQQFDVVRQPSSEWSAFDLEPSASGE